MNKVILIGRLTRDPDVRYTKTSKGDNMTIARYNLAIDRKGKDAGTDYISCVAFGKQGEFTEKYLRQGTKVALSGHIQTGSYTNKDGNKVYTTDVVVEEHEFCEKKGSGINQNEPQTQTQEQPSAPDEGFINIPEGIEDSLPFR